MNAISYPFEVAMFLFFWLFSMLAIGLLLVCVDLALAGVLKAWPPIVGCFVMEWVLYRLYWFRHQRKAAPQYLEGYRVGTLEDGEQ